MSLSRLSFGGAAGRTRGGGWRRIAFPGRFRTLYPCRLHATGVPPRPPGYSLMRTLVELQKQLPISAENGLTLEGAAKSRDTFGSNKLTPLPREPIWKKF